MAVKLINYPELLVGSKIALIICPLCGKMEHAVYPYDLVVSYHKHPIRRHFYRLMTGRNYGAWLKQYYADVQKAKNK